ncbi:hypothetical protein [Haloferula sp. A504]|uniref:hypothetical protein n=1 Tax=Haloferula sp. A504 TaxID=3373601 RepID=UPI0031C9CEBF|nr:hypothetical protein [Verrucomicrobiaceae bacterium E54]
MSAILVPPRLVVLALGILATLFLGLPRASGEEAITEATITELEQALVEATDASSDARKRLAVRRVIRDTELLIEAHAGKPERFLALEFLFRAQQQLIAMDDDSKHRAALMKTCAELVKAPDEYAHLKFQADLLLSQTELAKSGASDEERAAALRPLIERYIETKEGAKVLRVAMVMALELGDVKLVADLRELIAVHYAADHEMIQFQRDKLGGQVLGVPFAGSFKRSDGKLVRLPMDTFGRSTMVLFWSREGEGLAHAKGLAEATLKVKDQLPGRMEILSFNLDGLPDAGESIIRGFGADWQCLHLPGGRENSIYKAYASRDPLAMRVSSTGQAALIMEGVGRTKLTEDGSVDFDRTFGSAFARQWTQPDYCAQLSSLSAGDFLVFDPAGGIDPARPPELKAVSAGKMLPRTGQSVPEATLQAIQECFVAPPTRYLIPHEEILSHYRKAVELGRKAVVDHPDAPDLWIVRNRLIVALLGLWKVGGDLGQLEAAFEEARAAVATGYPEGCDLVARFCLAREALRDPEADTRQVLDRFVAESGGEKAPGPGLAAASMLALDVAERLRFEEFREVILKQHTEDPMMWIFTAFLLDRHHHYWLFQVPFTAGWSYGRREGYFQTKGDPEDAHRMLKADLRTADGKSFRIPGDLSADYTAIFFSNPGPWSSNRDDGLPPSPVRTISGFTAFADARPSGDVQTALAVFDDEPHPGVIKDHKGNDIEIPGMMLSLPGGLDNPLVHRLGMLSTTRDVNSVLVDKQGRILAAISGLATHSDRSGSTLVNVVTHQDALKVDALLEEGKFDAARDFIFSLAPPYDPEAVDDRGRKLRKPNYALSHLRARARVYMAMEDWDKALADAEEICSQQLSKDGGMSLRTDQLEADEALREEIKQQIEETR